MNKTYILDCTLRDGGYINKWKFSKKGIKETIKYLEDAAIDIIECGFLKNCSYNEDVSLFSDIKQITPFISPKKPNTLYVGMIALGDLDPEQIDEYDGTSIDGIRLTFHKDEWEKEKEVALKLMDKGYKVFIQPVGTTTYTDLELIELIQKVNEINPYAFYIVDTMGTMYAKELMRLFHIIENNLLESIKIGYHSHNNLQMAFTNAQELLRLHTRHDIIIDSSVFGMGRGAGNLSTELITQYINENHEIRYKVTPLLSIVDEYLSRIYNEMPWGYSVPYYLAAINGCHPNYATYLMNKQTINVEKIGKIINAIPQDKRGFYDEKYIENLYIEFQNNQTEDSEVIDELKSVLLGRDILILAPGKSISNEKESIQSYIKQHNSFTISLNFEAEEYKSDMIFISNTKRFSSMHELKTKRVIVTSNIVDENDDRIKMVNYATLLGEGREADNASAMLVTLLSKCGVKKVAVAGLDGFDLVTQNNYFKEEMVNAVERKYIEQKNNDINKQLTRVSQNMGIEFITPTKYDIGRK